MADYNQQIIDEFRTHGGRPPSWSGPSPLLLLHHRGARTGAERINPLAYLPDGERYVIFASKAGAPSHPAWYHNLRAHPDTTIEVGSDVVAVRAEEVTGDERDRLFAAQAERSPVFGEYARKTDRVIPAIALVPVPARDSA
jgi:deazaflavin-dependent oxidoreductase (nitroreductase family)